MYQSIAPLKQGEDYALFETLEYASLGNALVVPVASIEANALAHHYPIVWRRVGDDYELVAFISLSVPHLESFRRELESGMPRPLLVEAYPLALAFPDSEDGRSVVMIDEVPRPADALASPVFLRGGALSAPASRRMGALRVFGSDIGRTRAFTRTLAAAGLLADWPLRLRIGGDGVEIDGLCVLVQEEAQRAALPAVIAEHGFALAEFVTLHDLSLFNMQRLVDRFRAERVAAGGAAS